MVLLYDLIILWHFMSVYHLKYNFIAIDGNTGAGKTSLAIQMQEKFGGKLILENFVDNPFLPLCYQNPGRYEFQNEMFFLTGRYHQLKNIIEDPELYKSLHIFDYLLAKSLLYAEVNLPSLEYDLFKKCFDIFYASLPEPELIIYIHSNVDRLIQNIQKRGRDFEQLVRRQYLQDVEDIYFKYFAANPHLRILVINAHNLDFVNDEIHYNWVLNQITKTWPVGLNVIEWPE